MYWQESFAIKSRNRKNAWRILKCASANGHCRWDKFRSCLATTVELISFTWQSSGLENCKLDVPMAMPDPIHLFAAYFCPAAKWRTSDGRATWVLPAIQSGIKLWCVLPQTLKCWTFYFSKQFLWFDRFIRLCHPAICLNVSWKWLFGIINAMAVSNSSANSFSILQVYWQMKFVCL